jgi:hypothetical protein
MNAMFDKYGFPEPELAAMRGARNLLPSWMAKAVSEVSGG